MRFQRHLFRLALRLQKQHLVLDRILPHVLLHFDRDEQVGWAASELFRVHRNTFPTAPPRTVLAMFTAHGSPVRSLTRDRRTSRCESTGVRDFLVADRFQADLGLPALRIPASA